MPVRPAAKRCSRQVDERLRLTKTVAACLTEGRQAGKVAHSLRDLVRQRVLGLATGDLDASPRQTFIFVSTS